MASDDPKQKLSGEEAVEKVRTLLGHFRSAMVMTTAPSGEIHVRPWGLQGKAEDFDGTLWFFADARGRAVKEIGSGAPVQLVLQSDDKNSYMHLLGRASLSSDRAKIEELFSVFMKTWFPEGKNDKNLRLVRFDADGGSFWDSPGGMVQVLGAFVKTLVTGKEGKGGEMGDLAL
jgi:general stress protein 26